MKAQTCSGKSPARLISQSFSMAQSFSTGPSRNNCSSGESVGLLKPRSFDQSGLPENRSASHQTVPAAIASRSVGEMGGSSLRYQLRIGLVMLRWRQVKELMFVRSFVASQVLHVLYQRRVTETEGRIL